jgi:glycosyltransferase involved in cell wall biosynthesis
MKRGFVFCVCGNDEAARVNTALRFLKRFTKREIVVAKARAFVPIYHDQIIECRAPQEFTDQAAGLSLKTMLHRMMPTQSAEWCYLSPDVMAVDRDVDKIFDRRRGSVGFAPEYTDIDSLSSSAARCGCSSKRCRHLRQAIRETFSVTIGSGSWIPWNTGAFVFGAQSLQLLDLWHNNTATVLASGKWEGKWSRKDQWALAAAVWKMRLHASPTLSKRFNRVVDGLQGIPREDRQYIHPSEMTVDDSYSLTAGGSRKPVFLNFAGGTAGTAGWKNWDDVTRLIEPSAGVKGPKVSGKKAAPVVSTRRRGSLTAVHGMWIGTSLSRMELLTLQSFVRQGHRFHLWVYDQITTPIPEGVVLEDATEIIPRNAVFKRRTVDPRSGVGEGSYGAPFSDLFRYKLLHEKGGYWADMDVTCLKPFPSDTPYLFRAHRIGIVGNIMKCPRGSRLMAETYDEALRLADENSEWLLPNRLLSENVNRLGLSKYIRANFCNPDSWPDVVQPFIENDFSPPGEWFAIHWLNEVWRTLSQDRGLFKGRPMLKYKVDKDQPKQGTTLARLYETHGLDAGWRPNSNGNGNGNGSGGRASLRLPSRNHINVLVPTLAIGGAERIVIDTLSVLGRGSAAPSTPSGEGSTQDACGPRKSTESVGSPGEGSTQDACGPRKSMESVGSPGEGSTQDACGPRKSMESVGSPGPGASRSSEPSESSRSVLSPPASGTLFVMERAEPAYQSDIPNIETIHLSEGSGRESCARVASRVLRSGNPSLFVHLGDEPLLTKLWSMGVRTIPVVHNSVPGWPAPAALYNNSNVPFVVAVCEKVARDLREHGCLKRIVVVRHEIARPANSDNRANTRARVRARYGLNDDTLLVGMVGQFKRQKDYPKAVQVLAALRRLGPAKLMILGPWDHSWGDGRQVFAETYKMACDLDVVADLISVGAVIEVEEYYPAFDVLLSTSTYEGLSVSMMEAGSLGCPIVSSEVGGAAELTSDGITLLPPDATPEQYADAILASVRGALGPSAAATPGLIPELWNLLGQFGDPHMYCPELKRSVCVVDRIDGSGEQAGVVQRLAGAGRMQYVLSLGDVDGESEKVLRSRGVQIYDINSGQSQTQAAASILRAIQEIAASAVYLAGLDCKLRLLLAKVLPPEGVAMFDADNADNLFQKMAGERDFQRRIAFDESAYFRRISPWPNARYRQAWTG